MLFFCAVIDCIDLLEKTIPIVDKKVELCTRVKVLLWLSSFLFAFMLMSLFLMHTFMYDKLQLTFHFITN